MNKIEWTDETWNPIFGCDKISPGCDNCYALAMAYRLMHMPHGSDYQFVLGDNGESDPEKFHNLPEWNGKTHFAKSQLEKPLHWKKPRMIFVVSMGDLFHESVSFEHINDIFNVMCNTPKHTYQILTKRPERILEFFKWYGSLIKERGFDSVPSESDNPLHYYSPLKNVYIGATAENQKQLNKRIPILLEIPAAVRFVSIEPMLTFIDLMPAISYKFKGWKQGIENLPKIDWIICGGESGRKARPMHPEWVRNLRDQCSKFKINFFFKQWGEWMHIDEFYKCYPDYIIPKERMLSVFIRVKKKIAGRLLDGKEHNEMPVIH